MFTAWEYIDTHRTGSRRSFDKSRYTTRGLEQSIDEQLRKQQAEEKQSLLKDLQDETLLQKQEGVYPDLERYRAISLSHSKAAQERAITLAKQDAKHAGKSKGILGSTVKLLSRVGGRMH